MRGCGTSFINALDRFKEVLEEINCEKCVPIVFFLSDGNGESQNIVLDKCQDLRNEFMNYEIIFFTVGFTSSTDSSILEEMSKTFNKGSSILKICDEMCKLYYNANTIIDLERSFTMYEKFFELQKDLISFKQNMLRGHIHYLKEQHDKDKTVFDTIFNDNQTFYQNQLNQAKQRANDLGDLNLTFNQKVADLNEEIVKINEAYGILNEEKAKMKNEKLKLLNNKQTNDSKYELIRADFAKQNEQINQMIKNENDEFDKMIESQRTNIEANLNEIYNYLSWLSVQINDDFKRFYRNFQIDYFGYEKNRSFVFSKSMDFVNFFTNVYDELKEQNQYIAE
ncbi:unnamed protein product [Brachionus calyciflorus]|uniref:VWFA domain-containing protein n=1 Tax=Brachionus calyciflorus TaxID=104777 RepID=A0A813XTD9_9BILA|nr:unnamed protein product [Brachionus calyciflorus]